MTMQLAAKRRARTLRDLLIIVGRIAITAIILAVTLAVLAFLFPHRFLTCDSGEVKADALVLLGGDTGRAERAAQLYLQGAAPVIVVTGHGDCQANIQVLERKGVPPHAIIAEPTALTTLQNATLSVPLLRAVPAHRVIIVTSWYHSRRALACFEHIAPDLQFFSRPAYVNFEPVPANRLGYSRPVNFEYAKLIDYWLSHGVFPFGI